MQETTEAPLNDTTTTTMPLTRIQRLIGERMLASKRNKSSYYMEIKADVTELMAIRHNLTRALGVKVTTGTFYIRAMAVAVKRFPLMVGRLVSGVSHNNGDGHILQIAENVNVGFAVNTPRGLVVPVVRYTEGLSLAEIAEEEKVLTDKARSNKLSLEDIADETIALSNLGAYDIDSFLAIIPPQVSAILAAGKIVRAVVAQNGVPVVRRVVSLSLTADQRVIPCDYAAGFLQCMAEELNEPQRLI
ncbi:MAG: 2-oxo acid dehydrogenase subunit E2 [Planctomycetes bacterium]|nr:2-oxo acid dehydrogenase subunit E2 [Planctomycetota bacterium]